MADFDTNKLLELLAQGGSAAAPAMMFGGPYAAAIVGGGTIIAGLVSFLIENGYENEAQSIIDKAREKYGSLDDSAVKAAASEVLGPTALANVQANPRYRALQDDALSRLSQLSRTGLSAADRAALAESMDIAGQEARVGQERVSQAARQMGMGGSGMELAAALQGSQSSANRAAQSARQVAANAQDRALQALSSRTALAGNLETTDYNRAADVARRQDEIARFNNETRYNRAMDEYNRRLAQSNRMLGLEGQRAAQTSARGQRYASAAGGTIRGLSSGLARMPAGASTPDTNFPGADTTVSSDRESVQQALPLPEDDKP